MRRFLLLSAFIIQIFGSAAHAQDQCVSAAENKRPALSATLEKALIPTHEFLKTYTTNGFVFNGKWDRHVEEDMHGRHHFTDRSTAGYGMFTSGNIEIAEGYARTNPFGFRSGAISIFKVNDDANLRIVDGYSVWSEAKNLRENEAWKFIAEKYDIDIIVDHTGAAVFQKTTIFTTPRNWIEYTHLFSEILLDIPAGNLLDLMDRYEQAYLKVPEQDRLDLPSRTHLKRQIIQRVKADFFAVDLKMKFRYVNVLVYFREEFSDEQKAWIKVHGKQNNN